MTISEDLWEDVRRDAMFIAYSPFVLTYMIRSDQSTGNQVQMDGWWIFFEEDNDRFAKLMIDAYSTAEGLVEDEYIRSKIENLKDRFIESIDLDEDKELFPRDSVPLADHIDFMEKLKNRSENGFAKAALLLIPATIRMRIWKLLSDLFTSRSSIDLERFSGSYSTFLTETETILDELLANLDLQSIKHTCKEAMEVELKYFICLSTAHHKVVPLLPFVFELKGPPNAENLMNASAEVDRKGFMIMTSLGSTCIDGSNQIGEVVLLVSEADTHLWEVISKENEVCLNKCLEDIMQMPKSVSGFYFPAVEDRMKLFSDYEESVRTNVLESRAFKSLGPDDINRAMENLKWEDGAERFFRAALRRKLHIFLTLDRRFLNLVTSKVEEWTSNCEVEATLQHSTCDILFTAMEKVRLLRNNGDHMIICIGRSVTDLPCLLEADVGILLTGDTNLVKVGEALDLEFIPLLEWVAGKYTDFLLIWERKCRRIFTVESWSEIHAFILGHYGLVEYIRTRGV